MDLDSNSGTTPNTNTAGTAQGPPDQAAIARLIPHQGGMCLLQRVLTWDAAHVLAATATHRNPEHPLRGPGGLRSVHLCEYGAQAAALHGGLIAQIEGKRAPPGMLVALRDVRLHRPRIDDLTDELHVEARLLYADQGNTQYSFNVTHAGERIAEGRVAIIRRA